MSLPRFWVTARPDGDTVGIEDPREIHHAVHVLRLRVGDACAVCDGTGNAYRGRIAEIHPQRITVIVEHTLPTDVAFRRTLTLIQALPKLSAFETILRQATELGVTRIQPVLTARSVVRLAPSGWPSKRDRWMRILREASKQCRRSSAPELLLPLRWDACMDQHLSDGCRVMLTLAVSAPPLAEALQRPWPDHIAVCLGPEGDFTTDEAAVFQQRGGQVASLGPRILRAETAPLAVLAIIQHEWSRQPVAGER